MSTVEERVALGAQLLDGLYPDWPLRINLETLNVASWTDCPAAQASGVNSYGAFQEASSLGNAASAHAGAGFLPVGDGDIPALNAEWRRTIAARLEVTAVADPTVEGRVAAGIAAIERAYPGALDEFDPATVSVMDGPCLLERIAALDYFDALAEMAELLRLAPDDLVPWGVSLGLDQLPWTTTDEDEALEGEWRRQLTARRGASA